MCVSLSLEMCMVVSWCQKFYALTKAHNGLTKKILWWFPVYQCRITGFHAFLTLVVFLLNFCVCVCVCVYVCVCVCEVAQSFWTLYNPMDCSPPGSSVHGILQARILEWVAISFSRRPSWSRDQTHISCIWGSFFTTLATREVLNFCVLSLLGNCKVMIFIILIIFLLILVRQSSFLIRFFPSSICLLIHAVHIGKSKWMTNFKANELLFSIFRGS